MVIERAVLVVRENKNINPNDLALTGKDYFAAGGRDRRSEKREQANLETLNLQALERQAIVIALERTNWIQKDAADLLGISPRALNYKISQHNVTHAGWRKHS